MVRVPSNRREIDLDPNYTLPQPASQPRLRNSIDVSNAVQSYQNKQCVVCKITLLYDKQSKAHHNRHRTDKHINGTYGSDRYNND